jgi:acyl CoA:acetate/3-ketoacid CoA transferase
VSELDPAIVGEIVGRPVTRTKVVSQSIEPGVAVAKGTAVDLVLTRTGDLGLGVVKNIPEVFKQFSVDDAFHRFVLGRPDVRRILLQNADFDTLTEADRGVITNVLADNGIQLSNQPGDDANAAFNAFQAIHTFGG